MNTKNRRIIDLSMPIRSGHFRWPVERRKLRDYEDGDHTQVTWAGWSVHSFTHMDAGRHFSPSAFTTDDVELDQVVGDAAVVDLTRVNANSPITGEMIEKAGRSIREGDIVLMRTDWDKRESVDTREYWTRAPYMTEEAARWLLNRGIKAIAFDFPQDQCIRDLVTGDRSPAWEENTTHLVLLLNGVVMFEYLSNMSSIRKDRVMFVGLPLKLPDSDGAPARAIAIEED